MNDLYQLLASLRARDIHLHVDDGRLLCDAPESALTPTDLDDIGRHKPELLRLLGAPAQEEAAVPATRQPRTGAVPISGGQERLWFLSQMADASVAFHIPFVVQLRGELDRDAWRRSLDCLLSRHEALRTVFDVVDGMPQGRLLPAQHGFTLVEHDLRDAPDAQQQLARIRDEEAHAPFDLGQGPLIRGRLVRMAPDAHVFLLTQHHLVSDGWSVGVLFNELDALYRAFADGRPAALPPLDVQYADFVAWQRQHLSGERQRRLATYWREQLADAPVLLEIPADRPRPPRQSFAGERLPIALDGELAAALRALCQRHGLTLFMVLLAAWGIVLSRLSGQLDLLIGAPFAGRGRKEWESLIGFFTNTLALRIDLAGDPSVIELLARIRKTALDAQDHQDLPFEQVVEIVQPPRRPSHGPLVQVMFAWQNNERGNLDLPGIDAERIHTPIDAAKCDMVLELFETAEGIEGGIDYATALFDVSTVERVRTYWLNALRAIAADVDQPVARIDLMLPEMRHCVVHGWNDTGLPYPAHRCLHELFEEQVRRTPEAIAVMDDGQALRYDELNRRANRLAHRLIGQGVVPDATVALCVERSADMLVGILAILKAGGAYVPLDPDAPRERLAYMVADSGAVVLLTQAQLQGLLPDVAVPVLTIDTPLAAVAGQVAAGRADPQVQGLTSHNMAYVIYTSGSTGKAKGVMVEHHSAVNFWQAMQHTTHRFVAADAQVGLNANYTFDMSLKGILQLLSGRTLHVIPKAIRADGAALLAFLAQHRVDVFECTPSQLAMLLSAGLLTHPYYRPSSVLIGGEPIQAEMWQTLRACRTTRFYNMYGPTECTVDATITDISSCGDAATIGRPFDNMHVYILDRFMQPVPVGVVGEIHIGGAGVARGYLNRPELTQERFLDDPFRPGQRIYRSGDLGCWMPDGNIEYRGRADFQVKIRGYRIELGEIEAALASHPRVREAVVIAREQGDDKRLMAYVTVSEGAPIEVLDLRAHIARLLPEHMVPAAFVQLDCLPLNRNGKLDRQALPEPDAQAVATHAYVPPDGITESTLADIWRAVLSLERVGRFDHFFELGGHSLLVIRLITRIREQFDVELPISIVFERPQLHLLAEAIVSSQLASLQEEELNALQAEIASMSEEQLRAILVEGTLHE